MKTLGLRHLALNVRDPQVSKKFYMDVLQMALEWEPDADNVYLTSGGQDNLALHKSASNIPSSAPQRLDHLGFALASADDVDHWYTHIRTHSVTVLRDIKTHRDGARSFYISDPDGNVIQMIYHPPIAKRAGNSAH